MMARFNLPDIDFINVDPDEYEMTMVSRFEELSGIILGEADPRRKIFQTVVYAMSLLANNFNYTAKQRMLAYAEDDFLDHKGVDKDVFRIDAKQASTIIRFEVNPISDSIIPANTRLTVNEIVFSTLNDVTVSPGMSYVDVEAICAEEGEIGNGFLPNQISEIVDPLPWVIKAYNTTTSTGGAEMEADDPFAERIRQSNERYSVAGPAGAYEFFAKSADQRIIDVYVDSPSDGVIEIRPLLQEGEIPGEDILNEVLESCSDRTKRPLTDNVTILAPAVVPYNLELTYYISTDKQSMVSSIQAAVNQAVSDFTLWQKSKLGRGIDLGECISLIKEAGGKRTVISSPAQSYTPIEKWQIAKNQSITITYGGLVDE
jgi:phage-related baseplate assembly protein